MSLNNFLSYIKNPIKVAAIDRGFSVDMIDRILSKAPKVTDSVTANKEFKTVVVLPYFPKIITQISRILIKFSFKVVFLSDR